MAETMFSSDSSCASVGLCARSESVTQTGFWGVIKLIAPKR